MRKNNLLSYLVFLILLGVLTFLPMINTISVKSQSRADNNFFSIGDDESSQMYFNTFFGGNESDGGTSITIDSTGNCFITGITESDDFPTLNAYDNSFNGERDSFIAKFSPSGSLLWSTYIGGENMDSISAIALDKNDNSFIIGWTYSSNFPTKEAYNSTFGGWCDIFIMKFSSNGELLWSTFFGGNDMDQGLGIDVDYSGNCYIVGITFSINYPTLNSYDDTLSGESDAILAKFSSSGNLLWSTFFGGSNTDHCYDIVVNTSGNCFITGETSSNDFPVLNAYDDFYNGGLDTFVSKFSSIGSLLWSTYIGDYLYDIWPSGIALDKDENCYVTGSMLVDNISPEENYYNPSCIGNFNAFVFKFTTDGIFLWDTNIGGDLNEIGSSIVVDANGNVYITGGFFYVLCLFGLQANEITIQDDIFVIKFSSNNTLLGSITWGGSKSEGGSDITIDDNGNLYVTGGTSSEDYPTLNAYDDTLNGINDAIIAKLNNTVNTISTIKVGIRILPIYAIIIPSIIALVAVIKKNKKPF